MEAVRACVLVFRSMFWLTFNKIHLNLAKPTSMQFFRSTSMLHQTILAHC